MNSQSFLTFLPASLVASLSQSNRDSELLLMGTGLTLSALADPSKEVSYSVLETILKNAASFWPHPGLGLHYGNNLSAIDFGLVGQSMATSPTLREAIAFFLEYHKFGLRILDITADIEPDCVTVNFQATHPKATANRFFIDAAIAALCRLISSIYPGGFKSSAKMIMDDGGYPSAYEALFTEGVTFNAAENSVSLYGLNLESRLKNSDPMNHAQLRRACEKELRKRPNNSITANRVRNYIRQHLQAPPKLAETAKALGYSDRSLKRQLAKEGQTYRKIVTNMRGEYMLELLADTGLSISEISHMLGYDNYANFARAFKKQHGITPAQYR